MGLLSPILRNSEGGRLTWWCPGCDGFVVDGRMQFLGDCTHALAGQTVDIPAWPKPMWSDG